MQTTTFECRHPKGSVRQTCQQAEHGSCGSAVFATRGRKLAVRFADFDRRASKVHCTIACMLAKNSAVALDHIGKPGENTVKERLLCGFRHRRERHIVQNMAGRVRVAAMMVSVARLRAFHPPLLDSSWAPKRHGCWWLTQAFVDHSFVVQRSTSGA